MDVQDKVKQFIVNHASVSNGMQITEQTLIFEEGLFDSMGFMALLNFLQEEFSIQSDDSDLVIENFESIAKITEYIYKNISKS
jgi:acyl carrier protein